MARGRCRTLRVEYSFDDARAAHSLFIICECVDDDDGARNLVHFKWPSDFAPLSRVCAFCRLFVFLMRAGT